MRRAVSTAALGVALVLAAATFDTASLYVPGVALTALACVAAVWVSLAAAGATLRRTTGPATVPEEEPYPLHVEGRTGPVPAPGGELVEPLLGRPLPMAGRRERRMRVDVRFGRRGHKHVAPARLRLRDPLGLFVREIASDAGEVLVLPRIEPVGSADDGSQSARVDALRAARPGTPAAELELDSLRPHREGAPASRIHWPAVARTGELIERRFVADCDSRPLVVLDTRSPESEDALDRAVRAAASLTFALASRGGCALLLPGDTRPAEVEPDLRAWPALHARLAVVEARDGSLGFSLRGRRTALFWVVGSAPGGVPPALDRALADVRYLVVPGAVAGRAASFSVAGCFGHRLGRGQGRVAA